MLPYIPCTIVPLVLNTFEICNGIDHRSFFSILTHLLSMCKFEDPVSVYQRFQSLRLSFPAFTVDEAVVFFIFQFLKPVRLCPTPPTKLFKMKFFSTGSGPEKLKHINKIDIKVGIIYSFPSFVSRLCELNPAYHLPYSAYNVNKDTASTAARDFRSSPQIFPSSSIRRTPQLRNSLSRSAPSSGNQPPSSHFQRSSYSIPHQVSPVVACYYCEQNGHLIKDCPKSRCKASQKPRCPQGCYQPFFFKKHNTRRSVNQSIHSAKNHKSVHCFLPARSR
ncbi:hypothetical protein P9112_002045 [Eukaryota sp. TZLM1-RC]